MCDRRSARDREALRLDGIGQRIYVAAQNKDFTVLQSGVIMVSIVYLVATLVADVLYSCLQPAVASGRPNERDDRRCRGDRAGTRPRPDRNEDQLAPQDGAPAPALEDVSFLGSLIVWFWVFRAFTGARLTPDDPLAQSDAVLKARGSAHWFGTARSASVFRASSRPSDALQR